MVTNCVSNKRYWSLTKDKVSEMVYIAFITRVKIQNQYEKGLILTLF